MKIPHEGGWTFEDKEISMSFDDHVRQQLPWYDLATGVTSHLVRHYLPNNGVIYDIGASTGNIGKAIRDIIENRRARLIALEPSKEMAEIYDGGGDLYTDLVEEHKFIEFDVAVSFLSMMFVRVSERESVIASLWDKCRAGGAIIIFDKMPSGSGYLSTAIARLTLAGKVATGVPSNEIIAKELSLSGVQRPYVPPQKYNPVEVFRFGEFAGWVIEK